MEQKVTLFLTWKQILIFKFAIVSVMTSINNECDDSVLNDEVSSYERNFVMS